MAWLKLRLLRLFSLVDTNRLLRRYKSKYKMLISKQTVFFHGFKNLFERFIMSDNGIIADISSDKLEMR